MNVVAEQKKTKVAQSQKRQKSILILIIIMNDNSLLSRNLL